MSVTQKKLRSHRTRTTLHSVTTSHRPRLSVFRSQKYLSVQIIDDVKSKTIASAHVKDIKDYSKLSRMDQARALGTLIAERAQKEKVVKVTFDRGAYAYHGLVKALADGAREGGLQF